jgi:hypothetical protein
LETVLHSVPVESSRGASHKTERLLAASPCA